ncbi:glycerol kinase GlpK [Desertibaculum subflavum]|uniref:glycerol kinase GlpK n=1 Tax=Desertibaculum subflavum TaxID=2268458 RepID=UPI000E663999
MTERFVLAIDQGTTSSRAMLFDAAGEPRGLHQIELPQIYPAPGWVEHDPERIWNDTLACCRALVDKAGRGAILAIGITNQRETVVLWDRATGAPVGNAIVWQDRRTAALCETLRAEGLAPLVAERTGLVIDPYFSGTKLAWLLDNVPAARDRAARGELAFGTIDSFLLWRLTGGRVHATDATNAARTMLFDIRHQRWDDELLRRLNIPRSVLPEVRDSVGEFGTTSAELFGAAIPITGIAGDQQAATFGQAAFEPGAIKSTYGTGCFVLLNTGDRLVPSRSGLLSTIGWRLKGRPTYALEGSIFVAGAAVQWLRDGLGIIRSADETETLARSVPDTGGVYLVPAFVGLGAPWWDAEARAALVGLTRDTGRPQIARAALESVAYQTRDLFAAMAADGAPAPTSLKVDGGLVRNDWAMQFLADILELPVDRPAVTETTALGAARLAGWGAGFYPSIDAMSQQWRLDRRFVPAMRGADRDRLCAGWRDAVERALSPARRAALRN